MYLTDWRFLITFLFLIFTNNENKILETIKNLQTYLLHGSNQISYRINRIENMHRNQKRNKY